MDLKYKYRVLRHGRIGAARKFGVKIGQDCRVYSRIVPSEPWLLTIGDRVTISENVRIITHDGAGWLLNDEKGRRYRYAPVAIGSTVFVGAGSTIMPGVRVGDRVVIGAGSVVTKSVPSNSVVVGSPARIIGTYDDFEARLASWPSERDKRGLSYRERVDSIAETSFAPVLARPNHEPA